MKVLILLFLALTLDAASPTRQSVIKNLNNTVIPEITLDDFTIEELMKILHNKSGGKINFLYLKKPVSKIPPPLLTNNIPAGFDPLTGLPLAPPIIPLPPQNIEPELPRVKTVQISLKNVTLQQLLDITVICFDQPMKYVIMDFGIVFMHLKEGEKQLFQRKYKINRNIFTK
tara:strand:+ start:151 stop:666 length:516 start_codon:yes stop_codon:yes gene_type:complete